MIAVCLAVHRPQPARLERQLASLDAQRGVAWTLVREEDELGSGPIAADDDLIKLGIIDSLGVQQLVELCEARYGIRVVEADLVPENFQTLRELADYVERKRGTQPSASGRRGLWLRKR